MIEPEALTTPPPLARGARVAVVAPSGPFGRDELFRGLAWLRTRYELTLRTDILARTGFLAGDDPRRCAELQAALDAPDVDAIFAARGGYGATRLLPSLSWDGFERRPKWIVGFSDVTALHLVAASRGIASIHGPNVTGLGRSIAPLERLSLLDALERPFAQRVFERLERIHPGTAAGVLFGGNLALVAAALGDGRPVPSPLILALEDVGERPYRVDRMLTSLRAAGWFSSVRGIVFGDFDRCEPGPDGVRVEDVLRERTADLGIPVLAGAPFGHGLRNQAFILGSVAEIERDRLVTTAR